VKVSRNFEIFDNLVEKAAGEPYAVLKWGMGQGPMVFVFEIKLCGKGMVVVESYKWVSNNG
jgi:hypothetical protein